MRRIALTCLVGGALFLGGGVTAVAAQGPPEAVAAGQKTWAKFTGIRQYRPQTFFFGAHEVITNVQWSKWRSKLARGTGTYQVNNCIPSCADGTITPTPARIVLTGRQRCGKRFIIRRMKVYFDGHRRTLPPFCKD